MKKAVLTESNRSDGLSFTFYNEPDTGTIELEKYSTDASVTQDNENYSLEGAEFTVYTTEDCADGDELVVDGSVVTLVTDADGKASVSGLPLGNYWVKETKAAPGYELCDNAVPAAVTVETTEAGEDEDGETDPSNRVYAVAVGETPGHGNLSIEKSSGDTDTTDGNSYYSLEGGVYTIYPTWDDAENYTDPIGTISIDEDGNGTYGYDLPNAVYYVRETVAPQGYQLDETIYTADLSATDSSVTVSYTLETTDYPEFGRLRIYKDTSYRELSDQLDNYTLDEAQYGVYTSEKDAEAGSNAYAYLTTDETGYSSYLEDMPYGIYYVKEAAAPSGFLLDETIYVVEISSATVDVDLQVTFSVTDDETYSSDTLMIKKLSAQENAPGPLSGAQFVIQYYDGDYSTQDEIQDASPAERYWVIETKEVNGEYITELSEDYLVEGSDSLFYDKDGNVILPVGTYTMYESLPPDLYSEEGDWFDSEGNVLARLNSDEETESKTTRSSSR